MTEPKAPKRTKAWRELQTDSPAMKAYRHITRGWTAVSSVQVVNNGFQPPHTEWCVSFTGPNGKTLSNKHIRKAVQEFGLEDFEEDNHEDGRARKFWLAVMPEFRTPCPCKDEETVTRDDDYIWSRKKMVIPEAQRRQFGE